MDLALAMGMPHAELAERMTESEFFDWDRYDSQKGLPWKRIERQLARIAMFLDLGLLGKGRARLSEYFPDEEPVGAAEAAIADAVEEPFSGGIVIKRNG